MQSSIFFWVFVPILLSIFKILLWPQLQAGPLKNVRIPKDKDSGKQRTFGFIEYQHDVSVPYACELLDGLKLFGRPIRCKPQGQDSRNGSPAQSPNRSFSKPDQSPYRPYSAPDQSPIRSYSGPDQSPNRSYSDDERNGSYSNGRYDNYSNERNGYRNNERNTSYNNGYSPSPYNSRNSSYDSRDSPVRREDRNSQSWSDRNSQEFKSPQGTPLNHGPKYQNQSRSNRPQANLTLPSPEQQQSLMSLLPSKLSPTVLNSLRNQTLANQHYNKLRDNGRNPDRGSLSRSHSMQHGRSSPRNIRRQNSQPYWFMLR